MRWSDVRAAHPDSWLVIEALDARTVGGTRVIERVAVVEVCGDGRVTMRRYADHRRRHPDREFCFVHTSAADLRFEERSWIGLRGLHGADAPR